MPRLEEAEAERKRLEAEQWATTGLERYKEWCRDFGEQEANDKLESWLSDRSVRNSPAELVLFPDLLNEIRLRTKEKIRDWRYERIAERARSRSMRLNEDETKQVVKELGLEPRPVSQSLGDATTSVVVSLRRSKPFLANAGKSWSLKRGERGSIETFMLRLGNDTLLWLKGILERKPNFPGPNESLGYVFGMSIAQIKSCLTDEIKMVKAAVRVRDRWKSILDELTSLPVAGEEQQTDTKSDRKYIQATKAANEEAYRIAKTYRRKGKSIPFGTIAEQVMNKQFVGLIKRETGIKTRNGQSELTKEWKAKREAIRGTLRNKLKN